MSPSGFKIFHSRHCCRKSYRSCIRKNLYFIKFKKEKTAVASGRVAVRCDGQMRRPFAYFQPIEFKIVAYYGLHKTVKLRKNWIPFLNENIDGRVHEKDGRMGESLKPNRQTKNLTDFTVWYIQLLIFPKQKFQTVLSVNDFGECNRYIMITFHT